VFTGLIEATGRIVTGVEGTTGGRVDVETVLGAELAVGDSIAVDGICLTAVRVSPQGFSADVSPQTLRVTAAGRWTAGARVNLERPLRADGRLGGHFVLGHVDGVSRVRTVRPDGDSVWLEVSLPAELAACVIPKGSIAINGISLTVADLQAGHVAVQVIPHTWAVTTLADLQVGDTVNLEVDVLGKHVARLMEVNRGPGTAS